MNTLENIRLALRNVRSNLLRTIITLLIIAFGITALVGILTAIDSAIFALNNSFSQVGANTFYFASGGEGLSGQRRGRRTKNADLISYEDATEFAKRFDYPGRVSISKMGTTQAVVKSKSEETNPNITLYGIDQAYLYVKALEVAAGRNFSIAEITYAQPKAIIGHGLAVQLFGSQLENALGNSVTIDGRQYQLIGILEKKGSSMNRSSDNEVYIPLLLSKRYYNAGGDYELLVSINSAEQMEEAGSYAIGLMRQIRGLRIDQANDFSIIHSDSLLKIIKENTSKMRIAAIAIGLITLLGAAIGLMNIMLVSVTERTREVGIAKSLGATRRNILLQFLTEAVVICQLGGVVGVLLGIVMGNVVTYFLGGSFLVPWDWILLGLSICFVVGVVAGIYPAMKAAALDPVESLRFE